MPEPFDHHGGSRLRGLENVPRSSTDIGRFGRMFRRLTPLAPSDQALTALAQSMGEGPESGDNPDIPSGYTYLGQFVDHDITYDPVSSLERVNDPDALHSFRTPRFDLDSLYGTGRRDSPWLYDQGDTDKLLLGHNEGAQFEPVDLPRNEQGRALIGDPRNDIHAIIGQLHLAFVRFHNAAVDLVRSRFVPPDEIFDEARRITCWHYQWVVLHDLLPRIAGAEVVSEALRRPRFYTWRRQPFLPVEFSGAAYRFGHSQVRAGYRLNDGLEVLPILTEIRVPNPIQHLGGFRRLPKRWTVQWDLFFAIDGSTPQLSRCIDTQLAEPLRMLPADVDRPRRSLALLNLLRGRALGLPSGQAVAAAMGTGVPNTRLDLTGETPLWFYLLREADVLQDGRRLGPTGGRIVAEVLVGMLRGDPGSFLSLAPGWEPELPSSRAGHFDMVDLLRFADLA
ncbi:MAG: heme peroxidase family protein [Actinomycetota bacterium]|nr:heme peroxidase family protein [Actinomycetota bacterium]